MEKEQLKQVGKTALDVGTDFIPGVSEAKDVAGIARGIKEGDYTTAGIHAAGLALGAVPVVGDIARRGLLTVAGKFTKKDLLTEGVDDYKALRGNVDETLDKNTAEELFEQGDDAVDKVRASQSLARKMDDPGKRPFEDSAKKLEKDEITPKEFRKEAFADVEKFTEVDELPTFTESVFALDKNKRKNGILGLNKTIPKDKPILAAGDSVKARLDIPAYNRYDVYLPQITYKKEGVKGGNSIFSRTMVIQDVKFPTPTKDAWDISRAAINPRTKKATTKYPHATIDGTVASNPSTKKMYTDQEAHSLAKDVINNDDFIHVGYNPDRGGFFYDRATGMPVFDSPLVVQVGKQVFAKKSAETGAERIGKLRQLELNKKTNKIIKEGEVPLPEDYLKQGRRTLFNKGGIVPMEQQMNMAFMEDGGLQDDGAMQDAVSGNEVPSGSMDQEVRDDVPAMLSEGEYVVPADVVRFHGVKLFEQLRNEAKMGMGEMEQDGRIGGEPMGGPADMEDDMEDEEFPFSLEELEDIDGEPEGMAEGGMVYAAEGTFAYTPNTRYGQRGQSGMGLELRTLVNPATGRTITIPFYNGRPMTVIPEGFVDKAVADEQALLQQQEQEQQQGNRRASAEDSPFNPNSPFNDRNRQQRQKPFSEMSPEEIQAYSDSMDSTFADITAKLPIIGTLQRLSEASARRYADEALRSGKNPSSGEELNMETRLALQNLLTRAKNTSLLGAIGEFVTGKGGQTTGVPLYEQANYEDMLTAVEPDPVVEPEIEQTEEILNEELLNQGRSRRGYTPYVQPEQEVMYVVVGGKNLNKPFMIDKADAYKFGADAMARIDTGEGKVRLYSSPEAFPQSDLNPFNDKFESITRNDYIDRPISETLINDLVSNPLSYVETQREANRIAEKLSEENNDPSFLDRVKSAFSMQAAASERSDDQFSVEPSVKQKGIHNNPGNIEVSSKYRFAGQTDLTYDEGVVGEGHRFIVFSEPQFGFRALAMDARSKASPERHNGNIESMFLEYLGGGPHDSNLSLQERYEQAASDNPSDNPANPLEKVQNYIKNIQNAIGGETIDVNNIDQLQTLVKQIVINENTKETAEFYLSKPDVIKEGIVLASKGVDALNADGSLKTLDQLRMEFQPELEAAGLLQQPSLLSGGASPDMRSRRGTTIQEDFVPSLAPAPQFPQAQQPFMPTTPGQMPQANVPPPPDPRTPVGYQDPSELPMPDAQTPVGAQDPSEVQQDFVPNVAPAPQVAPSQQQFMPTTPGQMPQAMAQPQFTSPTPRRFVPMTEKFGVSGYDPDMAMDREAREDRDMDDFGIGEFGEFQMPRQPVPSQGYNQPPRAVPGGPDFDPNARDLDTERAMEFSPSARFDPQYLEDMRETNALFDSQLSDYDRTQRDVAVAPQLDPTGANRLGISGGGTGPLLDMTSPGTAFPSPSYDDTTPVLGGGDGPLDVSPSFDDTYTKPKNPSEIAQLYGDRGFTPEDLVDPVDTQTEEVFGRDDTKQEIEEKAAPKSEEKAKKDKKDAVRDAMGKDEFGRYTDPRKEQRRIGAGLTEGEKERERQREQAIRYSIDRAAEVHGVDPSMMKPEYFDSKGYFRPPKDAPQEILDMKDSGVSSTGIVATKAKKAKATKKAEADKKAAEEAAKAARRREKERERNRKQQAKARAAANKKQKDKTVYTGGGASTGSGMALKSGGLVKRRSTQKKGKK